MLRTVADNTTRDEDHRWWRWLTEVTNTTTMICLRYLSTGTGPEPASDHGEEIGERLGP